MQNAFSDGVKPGGLYNAQEIKILICYLLHSVREPMPEAAVTDVLYGGELANFFEVSGAIQELLRAGHLRETEDGLTVTDSGRQVGETLYKMIPYTLRERSVAAALKLQARRRQQNDIQVTVRPQGDRFAVDCRLEEAGEPLLSVSLQVTDEWQADLVEQRFRDDPALLYRAVIATLTGGTHSEQDDTRLVIDFR